LRYGVASGTLFFLSFSSELYVSLVWVQLVLLAFHWYATSSDGHSLSLRKLVILSIPALGPALIFGVAYLSFANWGTITYEPGTLNGFLHVLWTYTIFGFPGVGIHTHGWLSSHSIGDLANAFGKGILLVAILVAYSKATAQLLSRRLALLFVAFAVLFAFWVNVPVAYTAKYQGWVRDNQSTSYIYTMFSTVGFALAIASLVALAGSSQSRLGQGLKMVLFLFLGLITVATSLSNASTFRDQNISQRKWVYMDGLARAGVFQTLPANAVVIAPALYACHNIVCFFTYDDYWTQYLKRRFGINLDIRKKLLDVDLSSGRPAYQINFVRVEGISVKSPMFTVAGLPSDIALVRGLSIPEPGAQWTEGEQAEFIFTHPLPRKFTLRIEANGAFGPNAGALFKVIVGNIEHEFRGTAGTFQIDLPFALDATEYKIVIIVPKPMSPAELGNSNDSRKLGLSIRGLAVLVNE
jgi:hypothetical protein